MSAVFALVDSATTLIKSDMSTGMLCIFCNEDEAKIYLDESYTSDKKGVEIVKRYPNWSKELKEQEAIVCEMESRAVPIIEHPLKDVIFEKIKNGDIVFG